MWLSLNLKKKKDMSIIAEWTYQADTSVVIYCRKPIQNQDAEIFC